MTKAAVFDTWHTNVANSPACDRIFQRALGLPPQIVSNSLLTGAGLAEVVAALQVAPGQILVDLACGPGAVTELILQTMRERGRGLVYAVDPSLVELDRDYALVAQKAGAAPYIRVPALGVQPRFIEGLATLVEQALVGPELAPGATPCEAGLGRCALRRLAA